VGFDESGRLLAVDVDLVCNGGSTICCSNVVMDRGLSHFQNAYHFPALRAVGRIAYTHLTGNTAFRGFGVPQSAMICEQMVEAVARALRVHPEVVRRANLLQSHTRMSTGQLLGECHLARIWSQLDASAGTLVARRQACEEHNARHRWSKRGLSMVPTCYGVNFPLKYLNQAASYVLVYTDGSVLVTHGGTEMGQGLNTKVIQVV
jgi:xanthine dehydrogenase molybdopterin-binding subunit B